MQFFPKIQQMNDGPNDYFFQKFHLSKFDELTVPYHAGKFERILRAHPEI